MDLQVILTHLYQMGIAYALALPIAWNREKEVRTAGLRTFPLVAVAACGYMLVGLQVLSSTDAEARVMYGVIVGMGFIGGGAIPAAAPAMPPNPKRAATNANIRKARAQLNITILLKDAVRSLMHGSCRLRDQ